MNQAIRRSCHGRTANPPALRQEPVYDEWIEVTGVPIHRGHFLSDLRNIEVGHWEKLDANVAFLQFMGMEGVSEGRITEIPAGGSIKPLKLAVGETMYVIGGQGLATVWAGEGPKRTFEWQNHSMFHIRATRPTS